LEISKEGNRMDEDRKYTMDEVIKMGTEIGIREGIEYIRKEREARKNNRYDRRLRNTRLLLKEFRKLYIHSRDAICSSKTKLSAVDILDELDGFEYSDELYIESIKTSKERTSIIIDHVKKMMSIYKYMCQHSKRPDEVRRYNIIRKLYIDSPEATVEELSAEFNIDERSVYRDVDKAMETLTALVFGIDGLKIF
jgi:hypothetical protein